MNTHQNAPFTPEGRARLVRLVLEGGATQAEAAERFAVNRRTVGKWVRRFREAGSAGLVDRSSRPHRMPRITPETSRARLIELRRTHRMSTPELAEVTGIPRSTIGRWLRREGLGRLRRPAADEPVRRYERASPGELIHVDIKKLARFEAIGHRITGYRSKVGRRAGVGYDFVHVAVDDHSRLAYVEILPDERGPTAAGFLRRSLAWLSSHGVSVERVMSDNGSCYRSEAFAAVLHEQRIRHLRTRPYTPKTNGKAERFIGTMVREWAYGRPYATSKSRAELLPCWLRFYNERRPHGSLGRRPPAQADRHNVVSNHN